MPAPAQPIPAAYRIFFTSLDPLVALGGAYLHFFLPETVLDSYIPATVSPHEPQHYMLYQQLGGFLLGSAFLSIVLLRYTGDLGVWRILQASILIVDVTLLFTQWDALARQGRLSLGATRAEDWGCAAITGTVAVVRVLFLTGVWLGRKGGGRRGSSKGKRGRVVKRA